MSKLGHFRYEAEETGYLSVNIVKKIIASVYNFTLQLALDWYTKDGLRFKNTTYLSAVFPFKIGDSRPFPLYFRFVIFLCKNY